MSHSIADGVIVHVVPTQKYKTVRIAVRFTEKLNRETVGKRTLLSSVLSMSSQEYPNQNKVSQKLADMYGAQFYLDVSKKGNYHFVTASMNIVNGNYLPKKENLLKEALVFLGEMLFNPQISNSQFDLDTFDREKKNLISYIDSINDDKQSYAALQLQELYFEGDINQQTPSNGTIELVKDITSEELVSYYREMCATNPIEISVIGDVEENDVLSSLEEWKLKGRLQVDSDIFYKQDSRNIVREKIEQQEIIQSKLNLAFQTNVYFQQQDYFPLMVMNGIFGGFPHSKLFMNVREKESMAYYASSSVDTFRGIMNVQTGIDGKNRNRVMELINEQLAAIQIGEITEDEMLQTKEMIRNQYLLSLDNPGAVLEQTFIFDYLPFQAPTDDEWLSQLEQVDVKDVQRVSQKIQLQAVYFLEGQGS